MLFDPVLALASVPAMLRGMATTLFITAIVLVIGPFVALPITKARMSANPLLRVPAAAFVAFFRGTPALILLYLVYYGMAQLHIVRDGPLWPIFASALICAIIGLSLNHAAYLVEILRGGLEAVPAGLVEASAALGISDRHTFTRIRLPLAARYAFKAYQNEVLLFTKNIAVVGAITVVDVAAVANGIFERTYDPVTPMVTAAGMYWLVINVMRAGFNRLDIFLNKHIERNIGRPQLTAGRPQAPFFHQIAESRRKVLP